MNGSGTSGTCNVSFTAMPGAVTISGNLIESGNVVAQFSNVVVVQPNAVNSLNFTANPVAKSASVVLAAPSVNAGTASDTLVVVNVQDANGNTIAGTTPYTDANGNGVSFLLNVTNNRAGGRGSVVLRGGLRITAPGQSAVYAHYDGNWLDSAVINVSSSSSAVTSSSSATLTINPYVIEYPVGSAPSGIVTGPDGNIWFDLENLNKIGKMSTAGTNFTSYSCGSCAFPLFLTVGSDGNFWVPSLNNTSITRISIAGAIVGAASGQNRSTTVSNASNGLIYWNSEGGTNGINVASPQGSSQFYQAPGNSLVGGTAMGPDGNIWYLDLSNAKIGKMSPTGTYLANHPIAYANIGYCNPRCGEGVIVGPDNNVWFTGVAANVVEKITTAGIVSSYPLQSGADARRLTNGPEGQIWIAETDKGAIARIKTDGTGLIEYGTTSGLPANGRLLDITTGPDGNIWFTDEQNKTVGKLVL